MRKSPLPAVRAACLLALALASGCDSAPTRSPRSTQAVALSIDHPTPDVEIGPATAVEILLPGPEPGGGHVWIIAANNNNVMEQMGPLRTTQGPGDAVTRVSFYALRPGRSVLRFFLVRPSEAESIPQAKCELTVRVKE